MKQKAQLLLPFGLLLGASSILAQNATSHSNCCATLQNKLPGKISLPSSSLYQQEEASYYSAIVSQQTPTCRVTPTSANDVATALVILTEGKCEFAVRSGGHMPWKGANNIDTPGVTFDLSQLNNVALSSDKSVVHVGPGLRWGPVYDALEPYNLTIVGGRSNTVGVGGYLLGGGISHLNAQHGLAAQNVDNYQIVLANGTIANINPSAYPDLHTALGAGSTNYGIVTQYDLITYPRIPIFGGLRTYNATTESVAFLNATLSFMQGQVTDPSAGGMLISIIGDQLAATMADYTANGTVSHAFDEVLAVPFTSDDVNPNITQQQLSALVDNAFPAGRRTIFNVLAFKADVQFALDLNTQSIELFKPFEGKNITWAATYQPFGRGVTRAIAKKPSIQGIETQNDILIFGIAAYYDDPSLDESMNKWSQDIIAWGTEEAKKRELFEPWIYLNYALPDQDVFASFGAANEQKMISLKKQYDPENVFGQLWPGGFKLKV
ncbi:hypothetical protein DFH06DRAFT_1348718 [Mycena polygramma]|nr:hypothetical protein DFH06DRAFT_1348718 [Mycena polygramma]